MSCSHKTHDIAFVEHPNPGKLHHVSFRMPSWERVQRAGDITGMKQGARRYRTDSSRRYSRRDDLRIRDPSRQSVRRPLLVAMTVSRLGSPSHGHLMNSVMGSISPSSENYMRASWA